MSIDSPFADVIVLVGNDTSRIVYDYVKRSDKKPVADPTSGRPPATLGKCINRVPWQYPLRWLFAGAHDIVNTRGRSLVFGVCFVAMGHAIAQAHARDASWITGFTAGFLFLGPLLAVGIYELSRQHEGRQPCDLLLALFAWCRNPRGLCLFALLLCILLSVWLNTSWTLLNGQGWLISIMAETTLHPVDAWWSVWVLVSILTFAISVIAVPMLLDQAVTAGTAIRASIVCCRQNPVTMGLWGLTVAVVIGLSLMLDFWPLLLTGPWIGHATWHAYRDCTTPQG